MTQLEAQTNAASYSVAIAPEAWAAIGRLPGETFARVRARLLELIAEALRKHPGEIALPTEVVIDGHAVSCRLDLARRMVWLVGVTRC